MPTTSVTGWRAESVSDRSTLRNCGRLRSCGSPGRAVAVGLGNLCRLCGTGQETGGSGPEESGRNRLLGLGVWSKGK